MERLCGCGHTTIVPEEYKSWVCLGCGQECNAGYWHAKDDGRHEHVPASRQRRRLTSADREMARVRIDLSKANEANDIGREAVKNMSMEVKRSALENYALMTLLCEYTGVGATGLRETIKSRARELGEKVGVSAGMRDKGGWCELRNALRSILSYCKGDTCPVCCELLDVPDNDNGDGEYLGHALDCPVPNCQEQLAGSDA